MPAVQLAGISKRFGSVQANRDVSLTIARGHIHGIVGENGAGKSTLMSILYGYYQADSGVIRLQGRPVTIANSQAAIAEGIGMVHQHFMLVDNFTVLENIVLGVEGGGLLAKGLAKARAVLAGLQRDYGLEVDPDAITGELPVGLQQRVEILKALYRGADILILDEPTAVLTPQEVDHLFRILRALRDEGKTIILITHKLREIMELTDRVTVMRAGAVVADLVTAETSRDALAEAMVGRHVVLPRSQSRPPGPALLTVDRLCQTGADGRNRLQDISFTLHRGEILGVAGVSGNGQSELLAVLAGLLPAASGAIRLADQDITHLPNAARRLRGLGLAHVPEDRGRTGLVTGFSAAENAILGYQHDQALGPGPLLSVGAIKERCLRFIQSFDIRPGQPGLRAGQFSGGNQQKIVLAREIDRDPDVLLVGQPTRGVDIGAIEFIHNRLIALRDAGKAILLVSVELEEILALSDRILVMNEGRVVGVLPRADASERRLGLMMSGEAAV